MIDYRVQNSPSTATVFPLLVLNTFIRQKAEETDRQAGRQTNKQLGNGKTYTYIYCYCVFEYLCIVANVNKCTETTSGSQRHCVT